MNQDRYEKAFTEGGKTVEEGRNTMQQLFDNVHDQFVCAKAEQLRLQKELADAKAENVMLKAELEEIRRQRDCFAKDFFRLKRIVDYDYKGAIDTTCCCEMKRNGTSENEDPVMKQFREILRKFWGASI